MLLVTFEEDVILPTSHPQQDPPDDREVMPVGGVEGDLGGRSTGNVVGGHVLSDLNHRYGTAAGQPFSRSAVQQGSDSNETNKIC